MYNGDVGTTHPHTVEVRPSKPLAPTHLLGYELSSLPTSVPANIELGVHVLIVPGLVGCFLETFGRFRVDPKLLAELAEIEGEDDYCPLGEVPLEWVEKRIMGVATASGKYADICSSEWISRLRVVLAGHLKRFGLDDLDASVLQMTAPRSLTQLVSRVVFDEGLSGICYRSKYGHDVENWALFEPLQINIKDSELIRPDDPDLRRAFGLHGLRFKT
jgi:hypothetical protein